jgi:hypothetical protein
MLSTDHSGTIWLSIVPCNRIRCLFLPVPVSNCLNTLQQRFQQPSGTTAVCCKHTASIALLNFALRPLRIRTDIYKSFRARVARDRGSKVLGFPPTVHATGLSAAHNTLQPDRHCSVLELVLVPCPCPVAAEHAFPRPSPLA